MIDVLVIVNNSEDLKRIEKMKLNIEPYWTTLDERIYSQYKNALKIKGTYGARKVPFAYVEIDGKVNKVFYSEADNDVINSLQNYLNERIA